MERRSSAFWYLLSSRSAITSWWEGTSDSCHRLATRKGTWVAAPPRGGEVSHLDDVGKVLPRDAVVCLDEDLPQDGLPNGVVLGIELVKTVEGVAVLNMGLV